MSKQPATLQDRLSASAEEVRERATKTAPGPEPETRCLRKSYRPTKPHNFYNWINSPELQPPNDHHGTVVLSSLLPSGSGIGNFVRVRLINTSTLEHDRRRRSHPSAIHRAACPARHVLPAA